MYGTSEITDEQALDLLEQVFDRVVDLQPLNALTGAIGEVSKPVPNLKQAAIGFDSSVFIRLATHRRSVDILDYLPNHKGPLVLPGQAVQEFWNNRLAAIDTVGRSLEKKFQALADDVQKVDAQFGDFEHETKQMLERFQRDFGYIYDKKTKDRVAKMLLILEENATCRFVPRSRFISLANFRKRTKTPPGFRDDGDGDFFIWADFLFSLLTWSSPDRSGGFSHVILLTNEKKPDWSTNGRPHPILAAEVNCLFKARLDLWDLETFIDAVEGVV
ncbi:PIN-like domain-containing protein [Nocardia farcinica]|uniref:PIN-like domain-containing protein n=1 Tax=Nocardia farcinica TaxID=37329 RepID=UPI0024561DFA|nr:PIN-like domain-containing protein [Nocardia farcinica]